MTARGSFKKRKAQDKHPSAACERNHGREDTGDERLDGCQRSICPTLNISPPCDSCGILKDQTIAEVIVEWSSCPSESCDHTSIGVEEEKKGVMHGIKQLRNLFIYQYLTKLVLCGAYPSGESPSHRAVRHLIVRTAIKP